MLLRHGARYVRNCNVRMFSTRDAVPNPSTMRMPVYTHSDYTISLPAKHTFPMDRYEKVAQRLSSLNDPLIDFRSNPRLATMNEVKAVHDPTFVNAFVNGELDQLQQRQIGFPWSKEFVRRTFRIQGGTLSATEDVLVHGYAVAGNLAGGTHHAFRDHGEGYCVFNDIAIAATFALEHYSSVVKQCIVIDLDVHQGNGTADIFKDNAKVFTWSVHGDKNYPWKTRRASDLDIAVMDGINHEKYIYYVKEGLRQIEQRVDLESIVEWPEGNEIIRPLVFYQAGVDPLAEDRLGRLKLSRATLQARNQLVYEWCNKHQLKTVVTMGGGYSRPIDHSVIAHCDVYQQAANCFLKTYLANKE